MKAVIELTRAEYSNFCEIHNNLKWATQGLKKTEIFDDIYTQSGYAHYRFSGKISQLLLERLGRMPTEAEIIMLVDNGFSHFGATCSIRGLSFSGRVNID
ncbi:MAG TPA: hypothetical protein VFC62_04530 [Atopostipes sp.]|nr:hypothetical protein [Atopostipes sp.]